MERYLREIAPNLADRLVPHIRPAIGLKAISKDDELNVTGASKLGGRPDTPEGFEWPEFGGEAYEFIGQFNLETLNSLDLQQVLPRRGLLSFFLPTDAYSQGGPRNVPVAYLFRDEITQRLPFPASLGFESRPTSLFGRVAEWVRGGPSKPRVPSCALNFEIWWQLPNFDSGIPDRLFDELESEQYGEEVREGIEEPEFAHQLLGYFDEAQGSVLENSARIDEGLEWKRDKERIAEAAQNWRPLFQLDSEYLWDWGEGGKLHYAIKRDDLAAGRFERVSAEIQIH